MKNKFDVSEEEKNRIRGLINEEKGLLTEGIWKARKTESKRCQADGITDYFIGAKCTHHKMLIDMDTPKVGDYFINKESRNGNLTNDWSGTNAAGSDGKTYKVTKVFKLEETGMLRKSYNFPKASACDPAPVDPSWECINGTCSDPGTGNGQYSSLNDCETQTNYCTPLPWTCVYEWPQTNFIITYLQTNSHCYQWQNWSNANNALPAGAQNYATAQDCYSNCEPAAPDPSWDCDGQGNCSDPGTGNGQYSSLNDCNNNCVIPAYRCHDCNTPCSQQLIDAGQCPYPTTSHCQAMCADTNKWRCYRDKFGNKKCTLCKVYQMTDGTMCFNTKQECLASSDCGERRLDDDRVHTRDDSSPTDSPVLSPSNEFSPAINDGGTSELTQNRKINESNLRRIIRKVIKS